MKRRGRPAQLFGVDIRVFFLLVAKLKAEAEEVELIAELESKRLVSLLKKRFHRTTVIPDEFDCYLEPKFLLNPFFSLCTHFIVISILFRFAQPNRKHFHYK